MFVTLISRKIAFFRKMAIVDREIAVGEYSDGHN
jgi:hypothetical protein